VIYSFGGLLVIKKDQLAAQHNRESVKVYLGHMSISGRYSDDPNTWA